MPLRGGHRDRSRKIALMAWPQACLPQGWMWRGRAQSRCLPHSRRRIRGPSASPGAAWRDRRPRCRSRRRLPLPRPLRPALRAPRARACSSLSSTTTPAPSASTKPSRPPSNGRDARCGSSLRVDSARIWEKPVMTRSLTEASTPPAITTSAAPERIISAAWTIASAPEAQALTGVRAPPRAPRSMDTQAAAR
jgi:hypothetical protein